MTKKKEIKHHKILLDTISQLKEPKTGELTSRKKLFNKKNARFTSDKNEFKVDLTYDIFSDRRKGIDIGEYHRNIKIQFGSSVFILESVFIGHHASPKISCSVDRIRTLGFSENKHYYYTLVIPLEEELKFHYQLEETHFSTDLGYKRRTGTTAIINGEKLEVNCIVDDKKEYFLCINSTSKQTFEEFSDNAHAVKIGLGYLSGFLAGKQGFYFAFQNRKMIKPNHFRCVALRDSIKSLYTPIHSNPYSYLYRSRKQADRYREKLRTLSIEEFSRLCEKIRNSTDFESALLLILESSVASLLFMPGGYAIALETLSDLVVGNTKLKLAPIKGKSLSRKIRKEFIEVLDRNSETLKQDDIDILKKRIDQFNQTTNKAKLKAPFDLLKIELSAEDLQVLETRNDFLHGRVPDITNAGENRPIDRINKDLYYCSMRFYTLLSVIVLKWISYNNRVVNYPKLNEGFTQVRLKEEPFRQV